MEIPISVALGVGLAAACGFRVFLPLFALSLFLHFGIGNVDVGAHFVWMGSLPAVVAFGVATFLELIAYYIPFIDNLLDTIAVPLAAAAGTLVSIGTMLDMPPVVMWSIALIAGGGVAGLVKGTSAAVRVGSSATTAGLGNPVVSTLETLASIVLAIVAWFLPLLALGLVALILWRVVRWLLTA